MAEEKKASESPRVDGFKVFAKLEVSMKDLESRLRSVSSLETVAEKDCVSAVYVESRDISKNPYTFALFKFKPEYVEVLYSIPPTSAPKKRKLDMVRYFLNLLTYLNSAYSVEPSAAFQLVDAALKDLNEFVSLDYSKLYTSYDNMKKDYEDASRRLKKLQQDMDVLKSQNYELRTRNDELQLRVKQLEVLSDETLREKVQEWISEHGSEINISDFAKFHRVPETRVEEVLNFLVREGFIQAVQ